MSGAAHGRRPAGADVGSGGGPTTSFVVPGPLDGMRADRAVAMLVGVSRATAADLVAEGRVSIDGRPVRTGRTVLREGAALTVEVPITSPEGVAAEPEVKYDVVYCDPAVAVVDKPAGLVVHPGAGHQRGTLVAGLLARFPDLRELVREGVCPPERPGIVHRLDKGTSGLLAVARTAEAYGALRTQLTARSMERRYLALLVGEVSEARGEVDAPIGRSARTPTKMAVAAGGRPARTVYRVVERRGGLRPSTLVELALQSGRTHQIRVHMAAIGHPVVGDARYGAADSRLGSDRFFLHASRLGFDHPETGERMDLTSALPPDLVAYLDQTAR